LFIFIFVTFQLANFKLCIKHQRFIHDEAYNIIHSCGSHYFITMQDRVQLFKYLAKQTCLFSEHEHKISFGRESMLLLISP